MNNLSVTLITKNEENNLERCLDSLTPFNAEIIVIDCGSIDKTVEIAKKFKAKIYKHEFKNYADQKNYAISKCSNKWILSVDADELIPESLALEIQEAIESDKFDAYFVLRRNFILGGEIKHTRWSPDEHIWLWKKDKGSWVGEVHEEVIVSGKIGELKNAKLHYQDKNLSEFIMSNDLYSEILSKQMFKQGIKFSYINLFWDPFYEFILRYFIKFGFLDSWRGFVLSLAMAIFKLSVWIRIYELQYLSEDKF